MLLSGRYALRAQSLELTLPAAASPYAIKIEAYNKDRVYDVTDTLLFAGNHSFSLPAGKGLALFTIKTPLGTFPEFLLTGTGPIALELKYEEGTGYRFIWHNSPDTKAYNRLRQQADSIFQRLSVLNQLVAGYHILNPDTLSSFVHKLDAEYRQSISEAKQRYADWAQKQDLALQWRLLKAGVQLPADPFAGEKEQIRQKLDSAFVYFNPADTLLLYTPHYINNLTAYLNATWQFADTSRSVVYDYINRFMSQALKNATTGNAAMEIIRQWAYQQGDDELAMYIDLNYETARCDAGDDQLLQLRLKHYLKLGKGMSAPDILWVDKELQPHHLDELEARQTLIIFWASWCGHCEKILPGLYHFLQDKPEIVVLAIGIDDNESNWHTASSHYAEWIHLQAAEKWNAQWVNDYGVIGTPTFYLLDEAKNIVGKTGQVERLKQWIKGN